MFWQSDQYLWKTNSVHSNKAYLLSRATHVENNKVNMRRFHHMYQMILGRASFGYRGMIKSNSLGKSLILAIPMYYYNSRYGHWNGSTVILSIP